MAALSSILANMPPPSYRVEIPSSDETWHEIAAPIFLAIALFFALCWLARYRTARSTYGRAVILASIGFAGTGYTAWWIWSNRGEPSSRSYSAVFAVNMPFFLFSFGMLFSLVARWRANETPNAEMTKTSKWREQLLGTLVAIGFIATLLFAVGRPDMWAPLFAAVSILALAIWVLVRAAVWCWAHYSDGSAPPR